MIGTRDAQGWECIANNPISGVSTWAKPDGDEDVLIQERQDIDALLDQNKAEFNMASDNWKGDGLHKVASVPLSIVHEKGTLIHGAFKEGDEKTLNKILNDSDFAKFRTKGGVL